MLDKETKSWLQSVFKKEDLTIQEIHSLGNELLQTHETISPELFYELGRIHPDAGCELLKMITSSQEDLTVRAGLVAGLVKKAYELAFLYAGERSQGGRLIKDWSLVQMMLAEVFLKVELHEQLVRSGLSPALALGILQESDSLVSQCMQVMGGAGYTEDYLVEKLFRHIHKLKNSPSPFAQVVMQFYKREVLHL